MAGNVLQLPEGGDFGALQCQPSTNFDRSTKLDLTTEPPLLGRCCCRLCFCHFFTNLITPLSVTSKYKPGVKLETSRLAEDSAC